MNDKYLDEADEGQQTVIVHTKNSGKTMTFNERRRQKTVFVIALLIIPLTFWLFNLIYFNMRTILMAFQDNLGNFTLENFSKVWKLVSDKDSATLRLSVINSVKTFIAQEFIGVPISLVISYFIYKHISGYKIFRVIFYFPYILPAMVFVTAFSQFVSPLGTLAVICKHLSIELPTEGLLFTRTTATPTIIFYHVWSASAGNVLFYSAMSRVPPEVIEVGRLEGLSWWKELIYVVIPLVWPTISTTLILDCCSILNAGGPVLLFGNTSYDTTTVSYWFFSQVYNNGSPAGTAAYGTMSCAGLCFTAICAPITLLIRHFLEKGSDAEY